MVVLRVTRKLHTALTPTEHKESRPDGGLGDWYVTRFVVDRRPLLMMVSSESLLAIIEPARDVRSLPSRFPKIVADRLYWIGVDQEAIDREVATMSPIVV